MNKNKNIPEPIAGLDAVKMMREIREKLSDKYWKQPEILKKEMKEIREKYHFKIAATL
jgi:hypothetical protein